MDRLRAITNKAGRDWRFHLEGRGGGAFGMLLKTYVIGGMDPDLRELLYHAGLAMDAARLHWTILSAFRDDYRQSLALGLKAHTNNSLHGAVDIKDADGNSDAVWHWLDKNSAQRLAFNVYCLALIRRTSNHEGHGIGLQSRCAIID